MSMKVLCCILMLACCVVLCVQIRLEDKLYYGAIYEAERIRYERACKEEMMTREEAIYYLTWLRCEAIDDADSHRCEALNMAIEALGEEPKSKVIAQINVDADEIVKRIERNCNWKRPKGHWLEVDSFEMEDASVTDMRCSLCGKYVSVVLPHGNRYVYNFCPNCGADMRGEDNE